MLVEHLSTIYVKAMSFRHEPLTVYRGRYTRVILEKKKQVIGIRSSAGCSLCHLSSLQFADWSFVEPQEMDEIIQLGAHAHLIKSRAERVCKVRLRCEGSYK